MFKSALSRTSGTACGWRHHAKSRFPVSLIKARLSTNPTLRNKSLQESKESTSQVSTKVEQGMLPHYSDYYIGHRK